MSRRGVSIVTLTVWLLVVLGGGAAGAVVFDRRRAGRHHRAPGPDPALMTILGERNWYGPQRTHEISRTLWRREHA